MLKKRYCGIIDADCIGDKCAFCYKNSGGLKDCTIFSMITNLQGSGDLGG